MSTYENVTISQKANVYFDGKVTSRSLTFADGSNKTLGIMQTGWYHFNTQQAEQIEITSGQVEVKFFGENQWHSYSEGEHFNVAENSGFEIHVIEITDYACTYLN